LLELLDVRAQFFRADRSDLVFGFFKEIHVINACRGGL
jgi:hypothetical protein